MAKKSRGGVGVGDVDVEQVTPQAAQTSAQPGNGKRQGKTAGGASKAPGRANKGIESTRPKAKTGNPNWEKGVSGNPAGRPKGSRNKFSENLISAFCADFERNGVEVIAAVRSESPVDYLRLAVSIVPKQFGIEESSQDCFMKLWHAISDGRAGAAA
jgi:Family of unknown function (DUF5681)